MPFTGDISNAMSKAVEVSRPNIRVFGVVPVVYSTDRSKTAVPVLVLLFGALWFILRGDLLYVLSYAILFLCFQSF